jgi:probable addiction module antidote protein
LPRPCKPEAEHETFAAYLNEAFETGDMAFMLSAIRDVARARGMTAVAKETGFAREALYRALDRDGTPEFASVIAAFGLRLNVLPHNGNRS